MIQNITFSSVINLYLIYSFLGAWTLQYITYICLILYLCLICYMYICVVKLQVNKLYIYIYIIWTINLVLGQEFLQKIRNSIEKVAYDKIID